MTPRLIQVLLERPHVHLRPWLQKELGPQFMVAGGGEPEESKVIIVTDPNPERISLIREAYHTAGILVLDTSASSDGQGAACLIAGADGVVKDHHLAALGLHIRALARRLYSHPSMRLEYPPEGA